MDLTAHPCFDDAARHQYSRVHLPVAAGCNVQCNFCDRRFDCANESRPGVTSVLLTPAQGADYVDAVLRDDPALRVVGIAGPGDPLATPQATLATLRETRARHPELLLCIATNGLALPDHVDALAELAVSHVTVTVNAVDPVLASRIYAWVLDGKTRLTGRAAGERLLAAQLAGIEALVARGVLVKVNSILIPGVNEQHIAEVARTVAALGAARFNCMPLLPVAGTPFGALAAPPQDLVHQVRAAAAAHLPQMEHCTRCRADAVGRLGEADTGAKLVRLRRHAGAPRPPRVAVASQEGVLVNQHLGEARELSIYERRESGFVFLETRPAPEVGTGTERWTTLAELLADCSQVLVSSVGPKPKRVLGEQGLEVHETDGLIDDALEALHEGRALLRPRQEKFKCGKGEDCRGTGLLCG